MMSLENNTIFKFFEKMKRLLVSLVTSCNQQRNDLHSFSFKHNETVVKIQMVVKGSVSVECNGSLATTYGHYDVTQTQPLMATFDLVRSLGHHTICQMFGSIKKYEKIF